MKISSAKSNITSTKKNHFYMKMPLAVRSIFVLKTTKDPSQFWQPTWLRLLPEAKTAKLTKYQNSE